MDKFCHIINEINGLLNVSVFLHCFDIIGCVTESASSSLWNVLL